MKHEQLQKLFESNTVDGVTNFEAIAGEVNTFYDGVIERKRESATKGLVNPNDFIKQYDFENVDQFNAFVKNTKSASSELSEKATRLEGENKTLNEQLKELQGKVTDYEFTSQLVNKGVEKDKLDYAKFKLQGMINDEVDLDTALAQLRESDSVFKVADNGDKGFKVGAEPKEQDKKPVKAGFELYKQMKQQGKL